MPLAVTDPALSHDLGSIQLLFVTLAFAIALTYVARRLRIADPILLLLGGIVLSQLPNLPDIELAPDVVFLLFLPPILFGAAYFTPIRDFKANLRPILLLAIGLVLFTTAAVALVVQQLTDMPVAAAVALGAIVAPPDAVAATAIFRRLGVPRRIVTILEGESLLNDASALIVYRLAVVAGAAAASSVAFSLGSAAADVAGAVVAFVVVGAGGLAVGAIVGAIVTRTLHRTGDPVIEIIVTLLAPATAYIAAEQFGVSGVLATVVAGLITGRRGARVLSPDARLMGFGVWQTVIWLINATVFMLIGLQLPSILEAVLADHAPRGAAGPGPGGERDRDHRPDRVGLPGHVPATVLQQEPAGARPVSAGTGRVHHLVGRHARGRVAGRGLRPAAGLPVARPHPVPHVLRDRRDPRRAGPDAALAHPPPGRAGARRAGRGGGPRPARRGGGGAAASRTAQGRLPGPPATHRSAPRRVRA